MNKIYAGLFLAFLGACSSSEPNTSNDKIKEDTVAVRTEIEEKIVVQEKSEQELLFDVRNKGFYCIYHNYASETRYVILKKIKEEDKWITDESFLLPNYTLAETIDQTKFPSYYANLKGKAIFLYDDEGQEKTSVIKELHIISLGNDYGMVEDVKNGRSTKEELISNMKQSLEGYTYLVAEVDSAVEFTHASMISQLPLSAKPTIFENPVIEEKLIASLKTTEKYQAVQKDYLEYQKNGEWMDFKNEYVSVSKEFKLFDFKGKKYIYGLVSGGEGCGEFYGAISILWELNGEEITLIGTFDIYGEFGADYMTDYDNDGSVELWDYSDLIKKEGEKWIQAESVEAARFECGC